MSELGPPTAPLERAAALGRAAVGVGLGRLRARLSGGDVAASDARAGQALFAALGQLRGTALKLAQQLSLETGLLPDEVARQLGKAHHLAPPLSGPLVRSVIRTDLGGDPLDLFAGFEDRAFAAASIGQVHRARTHDGRAVAVKVRYPGIREAIAADLALLRRGAALLPESRYARAALEELERRLNEELDYPREAGWTRWFRTALAGLGVEIPYVESERSGTEVLTTGLLRGLHLDDWLATRPEQDLVDVVAERLLRVFAISLGRLHRLHADPNPGNVLFRDDGTVGLLDFGCVKVISPALARAKVRLFEALRDDDESALLEVYEGLGIFGGAGRAERAALRSRWLAPFEAWAAEPLRHERFDFGAHQGYCDLGPRAFRHLTGNRAALRFPADLLFVDRASYGLYRIFERLGARVAVPSILCSPT